MQYILIGMRLGYDKYLDHVELFHVTSSEPNMNELDVSQYDEVICVGVPDSLYDIVGPQLMRMESYSEPRLRHRLVGKHGSMG